LIDHKEIVNIANLASLDLDDEEVTLYASRLRRILAFFQKISDLDDENEEGDADRGNPLLCKERDLCHEGRLRPDRIEPSLPPGALLANTEFSADGFFVVKKVIE